MLPSFRVVGVFFARLDVDRKARRAYRAATTGMDRKLGVLMDELESLKLRQQTALVLHGAQLGGAWRQPRAFVFAALVFPRKVSPTDD